MNARQVSILCAATTLMALGSGYGVNRAVAAQADQGGSEAGMQVLTRGPVHEAFAEIITFDPEPGLIVSKAPPTMIEESPPDQRPEGDNVAWIPGYWGWDDDRDDYIWISGIWRDLPPDREWVPGYWSQEGRGFQWSPGYWADASMNEAEYLPKPPHSLENGPNIAAPSQDDYWAPGHWIWQQNRYAWSPGYWVPGRQGWAWIPAHYIWAPGGYVYSDGYWDYAIDYRGVLFAPVYFDNRGYARPGFRYSPSIVINLTVFTDHLFVRPDYDHYYFGDYYAADYQNKGFFASFSFASSHGGYDPIYTQQHWEHRHDADWDHRVRTDFENRRGHEETRPPRTMAAQSKLVTGGAQMKSPAIAAPFTEVTARKDSPMRFRPVANDERQGIVQSGREVQGFRATRQKLEAAAMEPPGNRAIKKSAPVKVALPRSPIVSKPVAQLGNAPPERPKASQAESKVKPAKTPGAQHQDKGNAKHNDKAKGK